jgi:hypothetical protein
MGKDGDTPERRQALHDILDIIANASQTPFDMLDTAELILVNVFHQIQSWESTDQRTFVLNQLRDRVVRDLAAIDMAEHGDVAGHA